MTALLLAVLMQVPEADKIREERYASSPHIEESFDCIDVYLYSYLDGPVHRTYHFGRLLADKSIGVVATHSVYAWNDPILKAWEDFHEQAAVNFYDEFEGVNRRCLTEPDHINIHVGFHPPHVPFQLITGFKPKGEDDE